MNYREIHRTKTRRFYLLASSMLIIGLVLAACEATPTPDPAILVRQAVSATLTAIPTATDIPTPTDAPTSTPESIKQLFCEYNFCIGHPQDIYLIDQGSTRQPPIASTFDNGIVFGYSASMFIEITWATSGPSFDPQSTMHGILQGSENFKGASDSMTIGDLSVSTQPITTVSSLLPYGEAAAWQCGGRDFAWKVYTPEDGSATDLLKQALEKFKCSGY